MEEVRHSCGHIMKYRLYGPAHSVQRQIKHREGFPCKKCQKAKDDALFAEQCKAAAIQNAEWRLPTLAGTSAQVAYAEAIRHRAALETTRCVPQGREQAVLDVLSLATEAKWWIDNKETNYSEWVKIIRAKFGA